MIIGIILTAFAVGLFWWQFKKQHEARNVVLLFLAFVIGLIGLWLVFDWIIIKTWV